MRRLCGALLLATAVCGWGVAGAAPATRVVTLAPHLAELVCAVGRCDRLVGVSAYTTAPADALPQVGDASNVNLEAVFALQPDLVLAWGGGTPPATVSRLRRLGLNVVAIDVAHLPQVADALEQVGALVGAAAAGRAAAEDYRRKLAALRARYRDRTRLRVFYQIQTDPTYSVSRRSTVSEALDLCGADNVFADLPGYAGIVSREAVMAARPQAVVVTRQDDPAAIARYWSRLPELLPSEPAFRIVVDADALPRQSPRVLEGIAQLCNRLDRVRRRLGRGDSAGELPQP